MKFFLFILLLSMLLGSCEYKNEDDCDLKVIPLAYHKYIVTGAGIDYCNGDYTKNPDTWHEKKTYTISTGNTTCTILYDYNYGWCITNGGLYGDIIYYSDIHTPEPPEDSTTIWQVKDGTPPAPVVTSGIYYYPQLFGNCL